jgi:tetratricopeptide (TPR) repeat protein
VSPPQQPAAPPAAPPDANAEAARHFQQGVALLGTNNYAAALAEFEESYRLRPLAGVLKNIAISQQGMFLYAEAIKTLERYMAHSPNLAEAERAEVTNLIGEMRALLADIFVIAKPDGATITVDRRPVGVTPLVQPLALPAGIHQIELSAQGYTPERREVTVVAGSAQRLAFELVAIQTKGRVRITASVPRAIVSIDGNAAGEAPLEVELEGGGHTIEVSAPNKKIHRSEIAVAAGQTRQLSITLEDVPPGKPWYKKWQYITPIAAGVVVIATGLTINYATTEDPVVGTLQPGVSVLK